MKQLEDPNEKKKTQKEKRSDGVWRLKMVLASPNWNQGWEFQDQVCPHGFNNPKYGHPDQHQWEHPPPPTAELGGGNVTLTSPEPEKGIFQKYQIFKNAIANIFHVFSGNILLFCKFLLRIPVVWVSVNSRAAKHHIKISKADCPQSRSHAEH